MSDVPQTPDQPGEAGRPKSLGEILRQARLSRGMKLSDVAEVTHVRKEYLKALEEGCYENLPEDVYSRNFLRLYAQAVGLSSDRLVNAYLHERRQAVGVSTLEQQLEEGRKRAPRTERPARRAIQLGPWFPTLLLVAALVALAVWGFNSLLFNPGSGNSGDRPVTVPQTATPQESVPNTDATPAESDTDTAPAPGQEVTIDIETEPPGARVSIDGFELPGTTPLLGIPVTARAERQVRATLDGFVPFEGNFDLSFSRALAISLVADDSQEAPTAAGDDGEPEVIAAPATGDGQISLVITEETWLEVYQSTERNSGNRLVYTTVPAGERYLFDLPVYVHVGNAAGVQVFVNGQDLGVLGSSGAVLGRAFGP